MLIPARHNYIKFGVLIKKLNINFFEHPNLFQKPVLYISYFLCSKSTLEKQK